MTTPFVAVLGGIRIEATLGVGNIPILRGYSIADEERTAQRYATPAASRLVAHIFTLAPEGTEWEDFLVLVAQLNARYARARATGPLGVLSEMRPTATEVDDQLRADSSLLAEPDPEHERESFSDQEPGS